MPLSFNSKEYDVVFFDCDGVILDSNNLKLTAMAESLYDLGLTEITINKCIDYFSANFGKSRFHHVQYFIDSYLGEHHCDDAYDRILKLYSEKCKRLYMSAELCPHVINFLESFTAEKVIVSGSEQNELRYVFHIRGLDKYFDSIFGSPDKKENIINRYLAERPNSVAVMFGDAVSDLDAATKNNIDFIFYKPFSTAKESMDSLARQHNFVTINDWSKITC